MKKRTTAALFVVLLLGISGLAYGVGHASGALDGNDLTPAAAPQRDALRQAQGSKDAQGPKSGQGSKQAQGPKDNAQGPVSQAVQQVAPRRPALRVRPEMVPGHKLVGPGNHGPKVRTLQARLRQISWLSGDVDDHYDAEVATAVRGFQAKRGIAVTGYVDSRTQQRLNAMTHTPTADELANRLTPMGNHPGPLDQRCRTGSAICIDKATRTLRWVVDGKVLRTIDVRFGASYSPTREGLFHVYWKDATHVSRLFGSAMPYSMFFAGGQAVHYSSDFAARGYAGASHGCVNVRDYDGVKWLFSQARVGDKVVIYWS